ncbi:hypothetical protein C2W64_00996 [Brevibacillus laterosporus]|nr:hypothetical protein C2W64_00996 [Brevibacillus laterosporus]
MPLFSVFKKIDWYLLPYTPIFRCKNQLFSPFFGSIFLFSIFSIHF